jgi:hypothetical protein
VLLFQAVNVLTAIGAAVLASGGSNASEVIPSRGLTFDEARASLT